MNWQEVLKKLIKACPEESSYITAKNFGSKFDILGGDANVYLMRLFKINMAKRVLVKDQTGRGRKGYRYRPSPQGLEWFKSQVPINKDLVIYATISERLAMKFLKIIEQLKPKYKKKIEVCFNNLENALDFLIEQEIEKGDLEYSFMCVEIAFDDIKEHCKKKKIRKIIDKLYSIFIVLYAKFKLKRMIDDDEQRDFFRDIKRINDDIYKMNYEKKYKKLEAMQRQQEYEKMEKELEKERQEKRERMMLY